MTEISDWVFYQGCHRGDEHTRLDENPGFHGWQGLNIFKSIGIFILFLSLFFVFWGFVLFLFVCFAFSINELPQNLWLLISLWMTCPDSFA